jgi:hypothetical protein
MVLFILVIKLSAAEKVTPTAPINLDVREQQNPNPNFMTPYSSFESELSGIA